MKIVCLGSGNVATHLADGFKNAGLQIVQIWSRHLSHAKELASRMDAQAIDDLDLLDKTADLYLISVKDDAIGEIALNLKDVRGLVVHTSGATSMDVLAGLDRYGVLYPLQTFSKDKEVDLATSPLCLEASSDEAYLLLEAAASCISKSIFKINSQKRQVLHLAAVFAGNFTNHLYHLSYTILEQHNLEFDVLRPLILETAIKVQSALPVNVQTGPSIRGDNATMKAHLDLLKSMPQLQEMYESLSNSIKKTYL